MICHLGQSFGQPLFGIAGGVANCIFFVLSGLCLGIDWHKHGCARYDWRFLRKRIMRLYIPFLCFLIPYLLVLCATDVIGFGREVWLNMFMLSWFAKLPGAGHLWFATGMLFQYALLFGVTRLYVRTRIRGVALALIVLTICLFGQVMFVIIGVGQGYLLMMLASGVIAFLFGDRILRICKYANRRMVALSLAICLMGIVGLVWGWGRFNQTMYYWLCMAVAISIIFGCLLTIKRVSLCGGIIFVSSISYEIYLIHYPLCSGSPIFLRKILDDELLYSATFIVVSLIGGILLNRLSKIVKWQLECKNGAVHQKVVK